MVNIVFSFVYVNEHLDNNNRTSTISIHATNTTVQRWIRGTHVINERFLEGYKLVLLQLYVTHRVAEH